MDPINKEAFPATGSIIYNVTIKVHSSVANEWLKWMQEEHINDVINTGCFTRATIVRLLETDETDGPTYAVQYFAESKSFYNHYLEKFAAGMRQKGFNKWGDKFIAFRSVMQVIG